MKNWWKGKEKPWKEEESKKEEEKAAARKEKKKDWDPEFLQFSCFLSQNLEKNVTSVIVSFHSFPSSVHCIHTWDTHLTVLSDCLDFWNNCFYPVSEDEKKGMCSYPSAFSQSCASLSVTWSPEILTRLPASTKMKLVPARQDEGAIMQIKNVNELCNPIFKMIASVYVLVT